jgi:hypothetical protein
LPLLLVLLSPVAPAPALVDDPPEVEPPELEPPPLSRRLRAGPAAAADRTSAAADQPPPPPTRTSAAAEVGSLDSGVREADWEEGRKVRRGDRDTADADASELAVPARGGERAAQATMSETSHPWRRPSSTSLEIRVQMPPEGDPHPPEPLREMRRFPWAST